MTQELIAEVRSWTWQNPGDGWLEHCAFARHGSRHVYSGLVVAPDFQVVYSLSYDEQGRRQEMSCRLRRPDGTQLALMIGNEQGAGLGDWRLLREGEESFRSQSDLDDTTDLDMSWSPLTNSMAIWRLDLAVGESREILVAWVQLPDLGVVPATQQYTRIAERVYRFEGDEGFVADLDVDDLGFVERYGDIWERQDVMEPRALLD